MKARLLSRQSGARIHYVWIAALCFVASGCISDVTVWRYVPDSYPLTSKPLTQKRLLVPPFKDSRPDSNINAEVWALILPLGWLDYSLPEGLYPRLAEGVSDKMWIDSQQFKPKEKFARAAAEELHASGLFKEVVFAPRGPEGDLVLYGEVMATHHHRTVVTYGVSVLGAYLWFIGFPAGEISNELEIEFQLGDRVTGAVLWRKKYHDTYESTVWIYKIPREFNYDILYKTMLRDVVKELKTHFQE
jgi:hypothetical protein